MTQRGERGREIGRQRAGVERETDGGSRGGGV